MEEELGNEKGKRNVILRKFENNQEELKSLQNISIQKDKFRLFERTENTHKDRVHNLQLLD